MLHSISEILEQTIMASDGVFGRIEDVFVDDGYWKVRFVVVNAENWLPGRKLLVPLPVLGEPDWGSRSIEIELSRDEIMQKWVRGILGGYAPFGT
jgi:hypothetical protein